MLAGFRATRCFSTVSRWTPSAQTVSNVNASLWQVPTAATQQSIKLQCDFGMPLVHQTDFDLWQHQDSIVDAFECPNDSGLTGKAGEIVVILFADGFRYTSSCETNLST